MTTTTTDQNKINLYKQFQSIDAEVQTLKSDAQHLVANRAKLLTQLQQNKMVESEFKHLKDDAKVYKLIGPVLVSQTYAESKGNVEKRIGFLEKEM
jgi:prefoldin beta subunit